MTIRPPTRERPNDGGAPLGLVRTLITFFDRNLGRFSPAVQNTIGLGMLIVFVIYVLNGFVAPTFIRGYLFVRESQKSTKKPGVGYSIVSRSETIVTNRYGNWMVPVYRSGVPGRITVLVYGPDETGTGYIDQHSFFGPWPVWNAIFPSEYNIEVRPFEPEGKRLLVSRAQVSEGLLLSLARLINWSSTAHAQEPVPSPMLLPPASSVLATADHNRGRKEIWVADESRGKVFVFDADFIPKPATVISLGDPLFPSRPLRLAFAPDNGRNGEMYIVDGAKDQIIVVDRLTHEIITTIRVGKAPRSIAITPNQSKAYVTNQQPVPQGSISVIELKSRQVVKTITGVNCPEGSAISSDGGRLYVASQCGAGQDPLFVIDTAKDRVVTVVPGLAVGLTAAITPNGKKVYVARGGFRTREASTGRTMSVPAQLSVVTTGDNRIIKSVPMTVGALAVTADGKHVLAGTGRSIEIIETANDRIVNTIPLATVAAGIAVTRDNKAYVWLPEENRLFVFGLSGLLPASERSKTND